MHPTCWEPGLVARHTAVFGTMFVLAGSGWIGGGKDGGQTAYAGPYLGMEPPGEIAVLFAPELFVRENEAHDTPWFTPDGREMHWIAVTPERIGAASMVMGDDGVWSGIQEAETGGIPKPDHSRRYFHSYDRPPGEDFPNKTGEWEEFIWYRDRVGEGWSEPRPVAPEVNRYPMHWQFGVAANDNLYFSVDGNLVRAAYADGRHLEPKPLLGEGGTPISGGLPFVAPDESYVVFTRTNDQRRGDLLVTFRTAAGHWQAPERLGGGVNTEASELCPQVTPDGKYLMYISDGAGFFRPFWVSIAVVERLKPS